MYSSPDSQISNQLIQISKSRTLHSTHTIQCWCSHHGGEDGHVGCRGHGEQQVGDVHQPGRAQRDLAHHQGLARVLHVSPSLLLSTDHVYLVDVEPRPGQVAHQLHRHDGVEEGPHGAAVVAPAHARHHHHHHHHHHRELTGQGS